MENVIMNAYYIIHYTERGVLMVETFYDKDSLYAIMKFKQKQPTFEICDFIPQSKKGAVNYDGTF